MSQERGKWSLLVACVLIIAPNLFAALWSWIAGGKWFFLAASAGLYLTLGYCIWRGERWAFIALCLLVLAGVLLDGVVIVRMSSEGFAGLVIVAVNVSKIIGLGIFVGSISIRRFMAAQREIYRNADDALFDD